MARTRVVAGQESYLIDCLMLSLEYHLLSVMLDLILGSISVVAAAVAAPLPPQIETQRAHWLPIQPRLYDSIQYPLVSKPARIVNNSIDIVDSLLANVGSTTVAIHAFCVGDRDRRTARPFRRGEWRP